jgi:cysteinyl-tRNA synthetase
MSLDILGEHFDLHCGGLDLKFPHHENERAQAVALGRGFAEHWMHHAFVVDASGEKMSKSLGNYENLLDLIEHVDPRAYRMALLQAHYRSPVRVDSDTIGASEKAVARLDALMRRAVDVPAAAPDTRVLDAFRTRMDDDLDTPGAMAVLFETVTRANAAIDAADAVAAAPLIAAVLSIGVAVGLVIGAAAGEVPAAALALAEGLDNARAAKDFAAADAIRTQLQADGWVVETTKQGTSLRRP